MNSCDHGKTIVVYEKNCELCDALSEIRELKGEIKDQASEIEKLNTLIEEFTESNEE